MFTVFNGGSEGRWRVISVAPVIGETLPSIERLAISQSPQYAPAPASQWQLAGFASNVRYAERSEKTTLAATQLPLGRDVATCGALIPIKKSAAWWDMTQEERRTVFEAQSHHIADSLKYLPIIARQLYHSRDLGEPFDFLTWFEYAPEHANDFEELVRHLRGIAEWRFVEREVDVRLSRD